MAEEAQEAKALSPLLVVLVLNPRRVVINRGTIHGVRPGQRFLIYSVSDDEIIDPISKEPLGRLEIVKGTGKAVHVQDKLTIVESDRPAPATRTIIKRRATPAINPFGATEEETIEPSGQTEPFEDPQVGDHVRPV